MVNFEDGTLVEGAYVEIGGVKYPVQLPKFEGNTPVSAENLNKMQKDFQDNLNKLQDNVESAINSVETELKRKIYQIITSGTLTADNIDKTVSIDISDLTLYSRIIFEFGAYREGETAIFEVDDNGIYMHDWGKCLFVYGGTDWQSRAFLWIENNQLKLQLKELKGWTASNYQVKGILK